MINEVVSEYELVQFIIIDLKKFGLTWMLEDWVRSKVLFNEIR